MDKSITIALVGNPNAGKTTVFNNLTGARQHVGNWPGVTVEKKEGVTEYGGYRIRVVDLPGVYGLTAFSQDEIITRDYLMNAGPDVVVVDIVDASNLERNLYLTVQVLEMGVRTIVALNMMDQAESRGHDIDTAGLSNLLGVPLVPMSAHRNRGTRELLDEIVRMAEGGKRAPVLKVRYGREIEEEIVNLEPMIAATDLGRAYSPRWLALKLLEEDDEIARRFRQ